LYAKGGALVDPTRGQMARYVGRLVGHYTAVRLTRARPTDERARSPN
jgi:hypothetical protein